MESRKWLSIVPSSDNNLNNTQFTVLSFNLLADALALKQRFSHCTNRMLRWKHRCKRILEELKLTGADILLVQEVDHFGKFYKKQFDLLGYRSIFDKDKAKQHGICIAFKKDKFDLISNIKVDFDNYPIGKNICPTKCILQLVKVQFKKSELGLILTNSHFFWNPSFDYERTRQFSILTEATKEFVKDCDFPVISGGDFNTTPNKLAYLAITRVLHDSEENRLKIYNEVNADLKREIDILKDELKKFKEDLAALIALDALKEIENSKDADDINNIKNTCDTNHIEDVKDTNIPNNAKDIIDIKDVEDKNDASCGKDLNSTIGAIGANGTSNTKNINDSKDAKNIKNIKNVKKKQNKNKNTNTKDTKDTKDTNDTKDTKPRKNKKPIKSVAVQSLESKIRARELKLATFESPGLPIEEIVKIIESNEPLQSAYSNYTKLDPTYLEPKYGYEPIYTNVTPTFKGTLDYIFYRSSSRHQIELESIFSLPDRETLGDGLPNLEYGSDHISLAAKFIFK